jgi:hypothetical protein
MRCFLIFLSLSFFLQADDFIASGPVGEVVIKNMPDMVMIESELHGKTRTTALGNAYRQCSRYLAMIDSPIRYPILLQLPEWESKKRESTALLQMVVNEHLSLRDPKEKGLRINIVPPITVVSIAFRGSYTFENWEDAVQKLRDHLQKINVPPSGPPRHLLYSNPDWTPEFLRLSEAQIPIPANFQAP